MSMYSPHDKDAPNRLAFFGRAKARVGTFPPQTFIRDFPSYKFNYRNEQSKNARLF